MQRPPRKVVLHVNQPAHQGRAHARKQQPRADVIPADGIVNLVFQKAIGQRRYPKLTQVDPAVRVVQIEGDPEGSRHADDDRDDQSPKQASVIGSVPVRQLERIGRGSHDRGAHFSGPRIAQADRRQPLPADDVRAQGIDRKGLRQHSRRGKTHAALGNDPRNGQENGKRPAEKHHGRHHRHSAQQQPAEEVGRADNPQPHGRPVRENLVAIVGLNAAPKRRAEHLAQVAPRRPQNRRDQHQHRPHSLMRQGYRRTRQRLVVPLDLKADDIENPGLAAAQQVEKPHREGHVQVEKVRHANDGEIDKDVQPHAIAEQHQRIEH